MKTIILTGEIATETKKQIEQVNAIRESIKVLSLTAFELEKRMWKYLKKEIPTQSENCTLSVNENEELVFIDRMAY